MDKTIYWENNALYAVDQNALPYQQTINRLETVSRVCDEIYSLGIRGATAIGAAGAFAIVFAIREAPGESVSAIMEYVEKEQEKIASVRPTATKLRYAVNYVMRYLRKAQGCCDSRQSLESCAIQKAEELYRIEENRCKIVTQTLAQMIPDGAGIITHCNTGPTCAIAYGGAIGGAIEAHKMGKKVHVYTDETRPRLQGAKLNSYDLKREGVPFTVLTDSMASYVMSQGLIDLVLVGADKIAANGDTAAKIGVSGLCILAKEYHIPVYLSAHISSIDFNLSSGKDIVVEQRSGDEVRIINGVRIIDEDIDVINPAFDITPANYFSAIVTDVGVALPPYKKSLYELNEKAIQIYGESFI